MKRLMWFVAVLLLCGAGCEEYVLSLKPLCPDESCISVSGLEGKWASDDQVWTFRSTETAAYEVRVADVFSAVAFEGRARRLGDHVFLELRPERESEKLPTPSLFTAHWLRANSFMQVTLKDSVLSLQRMKADELRKKLEERPNLAQHVEQDNSVILLDDTEDLARFVQAQAGASELWQEQGEFMRCTPLYSTEDLVRPERLLGAWHDPNESENGRINIRVEGNHYGIDLTFNQDEHLPFSAQVFKLQNLLFMGVFLGPEDMRAKEMATCMPDWYALITLAKDRLNFTVLEFVEVKELLADPEKVKEIQDDPEVELVRIKQ